MKTIKLGAVGRPINGRIVRRARLNKGKIEVKNPRTTWVLR